CPPPPPAHPPGKPPENPPPPKKKFFGPKGPPAGTFTAELPPWMAAAAAIFKALPAFCRVTAQATPSTDSDIRIEVWLPAENWNGKFQAHGNGGFAGQIDYFDLAASLLAGYATANTDTGHSAEGTDADRKSTRLNSSH